MGQKCSCLFNKDSDHTYVFQPQDGITTANENTGKGTTGEIVNKEYTRAISKKVKANDNTRNIFQMENSVSETNLHNIDDPNIISQLYKLQALAKGFITRRKYTKNKTKMIEETNKLLEKYQTNFRTQNLYRAESYSHPSYDPKGWSKFYPPQTDLFNVDYGKVYEAKILLYGDKAYFSGQVDINYHKHGLGKLINKDGTKYQGFWLNDEFTGWGRYIDQEGSLFEGYFCNGLLFGKGEKRMQNGNYYLGDFQKGLKEGTGKEETTDHIYEGQYKDDVKCGKGRLSYKLTNDFFEGEFSENLINGSGFYTWSNKDTYEGTFINGKMHGKGIYKWPDGGEYVGEYINNIKEGRGRFRWSNGRIFDGPFKDGKPHGVGKLTIDGKTIEVEFVDGKINRNYKKRGKEGNTSDKASTSNNNNLGTPKSLAKNNNF